METIEELLNALVTATGAANTLIAEGTHCTLMLQHDGVMIAMAKVDANNQLQTLRVEVPYKGILDFRGNLLIMEIAKGKQSLNDYIREQNAAPVSPISTEMQ
ncbi:hypothetical protein [uncultured Paraglaciecola sp.]|uniref:hypothetical protein n=1 Tax=uncultured Paraglaciecola sp. TaxID=1765024 RepID=UPI00260C8195|nr:hypothetical protein [uncultured Paraglaciecola sp.]